MSAAESSREELLDALDAVREAIAVPHPATVGDGEIRDRILAERVMHARVMLEAIFAGEGGGGVAWHVAYLRERLAEHPATGYRTWDEAVAELNRARQERNGDTPDGAK